MTVKTTIRPDAPEAAGIWKLQRIEESDSRIAFKANLSQLLNHLPSPVGSFGQADDDDPLEAIEDCWGRDQWEGPLKQDIKEFCVARYLIEDNPRVIAALGAR